jgi:hypothetical protein
MDTVNRHHTRDTWLLVRAEHLLLLAVLVVLALLHLGEIRWGWFLFSFVILDVIGYIPGAIAFRCAADKKIAPIFHHLYNLTHSYLTAAVVLGLWALAIQGFEWAMLGILIHLSGDRGLFGNTYKPAALPFEPTAPQPASPEKQELAESVP